MPIIQVVLNAYRTYRSWWAVFELKRAGSAVLISGVAGALGAALGVLLVSGPDTEVRVLASAGGGFLGGAIAQSVRSWRARQRGRSSR
jgi:hypothetical protein